MSRNRICAVVVTYNRKDLLRESLLALQSQTRPVDEILIVNNASTDGTGQMLAEEFARHQRLDLPTNVGGAGGFHEGLKWAYARGHDWFWCMDDDTIALPDCLEKLVAAPYFRDDKTGFLGSVVKWKDGSAHKMNMHPALEIPDWYSTVLDDKCVPVRTNSFVSTLISRAAVAKIGLPIREFFIWYDDVEFTYRISKYFSGYYVLDSVVVHKTVSNQAADLSTYKPADYGKHTYGLRNQVVYMKLKDDPILLKSIRIARTIVTNAVVILKVGAPCGLLLAMLKGVFFSPKIHSVETKQ